MLCTSFVSVFGMRRYLRPLALSALLLAALALTATPALAAPTWGIEMTHQNAYGAQGGVDPYTGSGTTFDRESGFNAYTITVKNTASAAHAGETLTCQTGVSEFESTFAYEWLRNGVAISGATASTYTLKTPGDEGKAIQCEVTGLRSHFFSSDGMMV